MRFQIPILSLIFVLLACARSDTGVGVTGNRDYTLTLTVRDRFIRVGDTVPVYVQLRRTDGSNLPAGVKGAIVLTTTANGRLGQETDAATWESATIEVNVTGTTTADVSANLIFKGVRTGAAEVRAAFQDATTRVEIVISG
jgi:hypothetical protein